MPLVLILEDEATLRESMVRGLQKLPGIELAEAGTVEEALRLLDGGLRPNLILSDIDLPDRSGIEMLGELGSRNIRVPLVYISAYLKAYGSQIPRHANVEVYEKPISLQELRRIVSDKTGSAGEGEEAAPFGAIDYLQLACLGRHSVSIEVHRQGKPTARIQIVQGEVWSAEDDAGLGWDAFRRIAFSMKGNVACHALKEPEGSRTIQGNWEELLMEAARQTDEEGWNDDGRHGDAEDGIDLLTDLQLEDAQLVEAEQVEDADEYEALWDEGVKALLDKDHEQAYEIFTRAAALRPDDRKLEANLARLREMGFGKSEPEAG